MLIHKYDYTEVIRYASHGIISEDEAMKYGLNDEENGQFKHMHCHSATIVGGASTLADLIMPGKALNDCHLGGGLHHAQSGRASGFCTYNDIAVTAQYLAKEYNQRVLIIDTDAHYGNGIQRSFYVDNHVTTCSIHETGKFLFPGSGHYTECGEDIDYGRTVNISLEPYTEDSSFLECFRLTAEPVAKSSKPDIILGINGVDMHYRDPLTHLNCTLHSLYEIPYFVKYLAGTYMNGKITVFGGGGYNIWRVVLCARSHVFLSLVDQPIQSGYLPLEWINKWKHYSFGLLPRRWEDRLNDHTYASRTKKISEKNKKLALHIASWYEFTRQ